MKLLFYLPINERFRFQNEHLSPHWNGWMDVDYDYYIDSAFHSKMNSWNWIKRKEKKHDENEYKLQIYLFEREKPIKMKNVDDKVCESDWSPCDCDYNSTI